MVDDAVVAVAAEIHATIRNRLLVSKVRSFSFWPQVRLLPVESCLDVAVLNCESSLNYAETKMRSSSAEASARQYFLNYDYLRCLNLTALANLDSSLY